MVRSIALLAAAAAVAAPTATAFSSTPFMGSRVTAAVSRTSSTLSMRVVDIDSPDAFDKTIESAGGALVVIDYSTTWCGPCKVIAPKFDELSDQYPDAVFLKVSRISFTYIVICIHVKQLARKVARCPDFSANSGMAHAPFAF